MLSLYEILKASKTGLAPDMWTALAGMNWGSADSGHEVKELTGIPPLSFTADGTPLLDYLISGNTVQNGTPTPDNPVDANGVGELTDNLANGFSLGYYAYADGSLITPDDGWVHTDKIPCKASTKYTGSSDIVEGSRWIGFVFWDSNGDYISTSNQQKSQPYPTSISLTVTTPSNAAYMAMNVAGAVAQRQIPLDTVTNFQVTESETVLPYEPYGYKIPISSASTTTPVYLGEVQTTRKIMKLVLTGTETWGRESGVLFFNNTIVQMMPVSYANAYCSHYRLGSSYNNVTEKDATFGISRRPAIFIHDSRFSTASDFNAYLAAQYAAGTPVTVWYVLETETTGIVNEPLMKIGDYADTVSMEQAGVQIPTLHGNTVIDVLTELKPSQMYIKYRE